MSASLSIAIACFSSLGGSGIIATELALGLARRGHRVRILAPARPTRALPESGLLSFHQVTVPVYPSLDPSPYTIALAASLVELMASEPLDILHVHYAIPHATSAYLARQAGGSARVPRIVTTLHGTDVTQVGSDPSFRSITRFSVMQSDGVTCPSEFLRRETCRCLGVPDDLELEVIPNFVDTERFTPAARRRDGGSIPTLFHASSFRAVKRVADLIDVLAGVRRHVPARMVLVGDGPERRAVEQRARDLGVNDSVTFTGARTEFVEELQQSDVFLLASESESFGVAALEALSCAVPVAAYKVGGLDELITPDVGRLVAPFDIEALTAATLELVTDDAKRVALGRAGRVRAETMYRVGPALDRYESCYRRVLAAAPKEASR